MRTRHQFHDEPLLGAGQSAAAQGGDQPGLDHRRFATTAGSHHRQEAAQVAAFSQAVQQLLNQGIPTKEISRIPFNECPQTFVWVVGIGEGFGGSHGTSPSPPPDLPTALRQAPSIASASG